MLNLKNQNDETTTTTLKPFILAGLPGNKTFVKSQKQEIMKTTILKISFIFLLFGLIGAGCEKNDEIEKFTEKEFFKFSDFGCANEPWHLMPEYVNNHYVITSQQELEKYIESDCIPQIDFANYTVIIGNKMFSTGIDHYDEKVEENNVEIVYTVTFLTNIAAVAQGVTYHVIIENPTGRKNKNILIVEDVKDQE